MKLPRYARLLPTVVVVGASLLVLKTTGLVHEAYAQTEKAGEKVAALVDAPTPANADYAGGAGDEIASASEVDVLGSLGKRRKELDARETQLTMQANLIAAAEQRVDGKIAQLKSLQTQIAGLLVQRDAAQDAQIKSLIKTYGPDGMKASKAAAIFNNLPDEVLIPVAQGLKPGDLGQILSNMNPDAAQKLTMKLANRLALPKTADAVAPAPVQTATAPAPAAPGTQAAATPAAAPAAKAPDAAPVPEKSDKSKT